jgi:hypothetical protein
MAQNSLLVYTNALYMVMSDLAPPTVPFVYEQYAFEFMFEDIKYSEHVPADPTITPSGNSISMIESA